MVRQIGGTIFSEFILELKKFIVKQKNVIVEPDYLRIDVTAILPGAQVIPPPGCEPLPHRYNPETGVAYFAQAGIGRVIN